ncbi:MAG: polyprenyl synthetase family protein [bacterium]|nr:polyprenyl synthetase family protein [bacterium]
MNFKELTADKTAQIETMLRKYLPVEEGYQKTVLAAMNYSILAGGKRLRPLLMQETYRMLRGTEQTVEPFMAALEMIHTYSLVHDDLPAMDNDEYRRGRKTTHIVYGEAMGVLAGDALLNYAFETALQAYDKTSDPARVTKAMKLLAGRAGIYGMIGGQTADIEAEHQKTDVNEEHLLYIHEHKTGALIQAAMGIGAVLAGADDQTVQDMEQCALSIGVAFQIQDDILDVTSTTEVLGKPVGSDAKNEKLTYVTMKGMEQAAEDVRNYSKQAMDILEKYAGEDRYLLQLVQSLITRQH